MDRGSWGRITWCCLAVVWVLSADPVAGQDDDAPDTGATTGTDTLEAQASAPEQASPLPADEAEDAGSAQGASGTAAPTSCPPVPGAEHSLFDALPPEDGNDWLQLKNGEWIQGSLLDLHNEELTFDSDEMDEQSFDLEDVHRLFIRSEVVFGLVTLDSVAGTALLVDETVTIDTPGGPRRLPVADILTMVSLAHNEVERWSLDASLGANLSKGNSELVTFSGTVAVERKSEFVHTKLDYLGRYGRSLGETSANNHRGTVQVDLFVSRRFFVTPFYGSAEYDSFKNVALRLSLLPMAGLDLIETDDVEWSLGTGIGYQQLRLLSVEPGEDPVQNHAILAAVTELDVDLTDDLDFDVQYTPVVVATALGLTTHHLVAKLDQDITSIFDLELSFVFDRTKRPVADSSGVTPRSNDYQLIASLGIEIN